MTEKELLVQRYQHDVRLQETRVRDAKIAMEEGYKKLMADFEREYERLKSEYERECITLEKEKLYLKHAQDAMEKGFET